jgi:hypothetical protein
MVSVMEPPQIVRPQTPTESLEPAANETEKLQVMIDVREVDFTYGDHKVLHNNLAANAASRRDRVHRAVRLRQDHSAALH